MTSVFNMVANWIESVVFPDAVGPTMKITGFSKLRFHIFKPHDLKFLGVWASNDRDCIYPPV